MKFATSYFYQIRNFKPYMIPFSTAQFDPKWFHDSEDLFYVFKDGHGVYNGLRARALVPDKTCHDLCYGPAKCNQKPNDCAFLKNYAKQLSHIDLAEFLDEVNVTIGEIQEDEGFEEEPVAVMIVYETPDNACSERRVIQEWFASHGIECSELSL